MDDVWLPERERMVERQLVGRGITDPRVLAAMRAVPRHLFVPFDERPRAYLDGPLPIGFGQTISQPYMVAAMAQLLQLRPTDRVLDIGSGCGYAAAVLSKLCSHVWSMELVPQLAAEAALRLERLGFGNVTVQCGDGYRGWPDEAPFDAIHVAAAAPETPPALLEQLAVGGRLVIPLGRPRHSQVLMYYRRSAEGLSSEKYGMVEFVELKHGEAS